MESENNMSHQRNIGPAKRTPWQHLGAENHYGVDNQPSELEASPEAVDNQEVISKRKLEQMHNRSKNE